MLKSFTLPNLICLVLIVGCLVLKGLGINGSIETILVAAAAFFFGRLTTPTSTPPSGASGG